MIKVENFMNKKNQFVIYGKGLICYQSYQTTILCKVNKTGELILNKEYWENNQTNTTNKYLYAFLREFCLLEIKNKKDLEKLIKNNEIKLLTIDEMKKYKEDK